MPPKKATKAVAASGPQLRTQDLFNEAAVERFGRVFGITPDQVRAEMDMDDVPLADRPNAFETPGISQNLGPRQEGNRYDRPFSDPIYDLPSTPIANRPSAPIVNLLSGPVGNLPIEPVTNFAAAPVVNLVSTPVTNLPSAPVVDLSKATQAVATPLEDLRYRNKPACIHCSRARRACWGGVPCHRCRGFSRDTAEECQTKDGITNFNFRKDDGKGDGDGGGGSKEQTRNSDVENGGFGGGLAHIAALIK